MRVFLKNNVLGEFYFDIHSFFYVFLIKSIQNNKKNVLQFINVSVVLVYANSYRSSIMEGFLGRTES